MNLSRYSAHSKSKLWLGIATLAVLAPATALAAEGLSYTYVEVDYINLDIDEVGDSGNLLGNFDNGGGWAGRGAFEFAPNWFVFGQYSVTDSDVNFIDDQNQFFRSDTDINRLDVGVGFHTPLNNRADMVFRGAYTDVDTDGFNFGASNNTAINDLKEDSSDGFFIDASLRSQLMDRLEGSIGLRYTDLEKIDDLSLIGNLLYEFSPNLGVNFGLEAGDNVSHWLVGLRYSF